MKQDTSLLIKRLYVYSPPYRGSDFFGHLVEHCISQEKDIDLDVYFNYLDPLDVAYSHNLYSKTKIQYFVDWKKILENYQKPLENEIITREIQVLREELASGRDQEELLADQVSCFVGQLIHSKTIIRANYDEIKKYHEQYYIHGHWMVTDDYDNRLDTNITGQYIGAVEYSTENFLYRQFHPKGWKYLVLIAPTKNPYTTMFVEFLGRLISYREKFKFRYRESSYHYRDYDSSYVPGYMYIGVSHLNHYLFKQPFFEAAKKYFLEKERLVNGKYMIRVWEILNQQLLDDQMVWEFIQSIQYEEVRVVIEKMQNLHKKNGIKIS